MGKFQKFGITRVRDRKPSDRNTRRTQAHAMARSGDPRLRQMVIPRRPLRNSKGKLAPMPMFIQRRRGIRTRPVDVTFWTKRPLAPKRTNRCWHRGCRKHLSRHQRNGLRLCDRHAAA